MTGKAPRRIHRGWGENFFLEPLYFWLDLYGPDGRPSHSKVLSAWGFFLALAAELWWASKAEALTDISWPYVTLVVATLAIPMGKNVFLGIIGSRLPAGGEEEKP